MLFIWYIVITFQSLDDLRRLVTFVSVCLAEKKQRPN